MTLSEQSGYVESPFDSQELTPIERALRAQAELNKTRQEAIDGILAQIEQLKAQLTELGYRRPRKRAVQAKRGRPRKSPVNPAEKEEST